MSCAILGGYFTLYMVSKLIPGGKKAAPVAAAGAHTRFGWTVGEWLPRRLGSGKHSL